jgi:GNAT superfamily N-acetyltransferase
LICSARPYERHAPTPVDNRRYQKRQRATPASEPQRVQLSDEKRLTRVRCTDRQPTRGLRYRSFAFPVDRCSVRHRFEERLSEWLAAEGDRRTTWLAWAGSDAIGMASLFEYRRMPLPGRADSRWGYLSSMFVRDDFRNQGVGSALLSAIVATAEERSYARLVVSPSERSVGFYERAGFIMPSDSAGGDGLLVRPSRRA